MNDGVSINVGIAVITFRSPVPVPSKVEKDGFAPKRFRWRQLTTRKGPFRRAESCIDNNTIEDQRVDAERRTRVAARNNPVLN